MNNYFYPAQSTIYPAQMNTGSAQTIQNGGFISVRSEQEARSYPVAIGNSVTFHDETSPYVYTKTMGFSQLDRPVFKKYKLVEEKIEEEAPSEVDTLKTDIKKLWCEINALKRKPKAEKNGDD